MTEKMGSGGQSKFRAAFRAAFPLAVGLVLLTLIVWNRGKSEASPSPDDRKKDVNETVRPDETSDDKPTAKETHPETEITKQIQPIETDIVADEATETGPTWLKVPPAHVLRIFRKEAQKLLDRIEKDLALNSGQRAWLDEFWRRHEGRNEESRRVALTGVIDRATYRLRLLESIKSFYDSFEAVLTEEQAAGLEKYRAKSLEGHEKLRVREENDKGE